MGLIFLGCWWHFFVFTADDYQVAIFVADAAVTCSWRWHGPIFDHDLGEAGVELGYVIILLDRVDLQLIQVIEENALAFALATEHVYVVIDNARRVTVARLWDLPILAALDPSEEFELVGIMPL